VYASLELAKERGVFKNWERSMYYPELPLRNATRTSIAPTGTISIIAGTSSSIEPLFALAFYRENILEGQSISEINPLFMQYLKKHDLWSEKIMEEVKESGNIALTTLPDKVKELFKTSLEIEPEWHIKHQVAFQEFTDNAVSKTINMPRHAGPEDIGRSYLSAWKQKAKGVTVFRYGSKETQVLNCGSNGKQNSGLCGSCS